MKFIKVHEIQVGDTIVWATSHSRDVLNYMVVESIEEGEDNFLYYHQDAPIYGEDEYAVLFLKGTVYCAQGVRTTYDSKRYNGSYPINSTANVLLVNRTETK